MRSLLLFFAAFILASQALFAQNFSNFEADSVTTEGVKFLLYLPPAYNGTDDLPLLVSLHGVGHIGNALELLLATDEQAPARLISVNQWPSSRPFIVVSPQMKRDLTVPNIRDQEWPADTVDAVIEHIKANYTVDNNRIYMMGLSLGGAGVWDYAAANPSKIAAINPIAGASDTLDACNIVDIPTWAFHGTEDAIVPTQLSKDMVRNMNECGTGLYKPKLNLIQTRAHDVWKDTWNGVLRYDVFEWMLQFEKGSTANVPPYVKIDHHKKVKTRTGEYYLYADFFDWDGSITDVQWTQESGSALSFSFADPNFLRINSLPVGSYSFKVAVTDNDLGVTEKSIDLEVVSAAGAGEPETLSFTLINGATNADVMALQESDIINMALLGLDEINIKGNSNGDTRSVRWTVFGDSLIYRDTGSPFTLVKPRSIPEWQPDPGKYMICATPHPQQFGNSTPGVMNCIKLDIYDQETLNYYAKPNSDISQLSNWGTETDGSGTAPDSLSGNFVNFNINTTNSLGSDITINGVGSELVVMNGGQLTLQSNYSGEISTEDNSTLIIDGNHTFNAGTIHPNSTIEFSGTNPTIPMVQYGHLTFSGSGVMNLGNGQTTVSGNLSSSGVEIRGAAGNGSTLQINGNAIINSLVTSAEGNRVGLDFTNGSTAQTLTTNGNLLFHGIRSSNGADVSLSSVGSTVITLGTSNGGGIEISSGGSIDLSGVRIEISGQGTINSSNDDGELGLEDSDLIFSTTSNQNSNLYPIPGSNGLDVLEITTPASTELIVQSALDLKNSITVTQGILNANGFLRLLSTSDSESAYFKSIGSNGQVSGNLTIQRYMSGEGRLYRYLSSPVNGATVQQLQNFIPVTGDFTGASTGTGLDNTPSMYYYDESQSGWMVFPPAISSNTEELVPGRGYSTYIREETDPTVYELTGTLNQGDVNFTLTAGTASPSDGWNLVGNPYASPIQWDPIGLTGWSMGGVGTSIYVRDNSSDPGVFRFYDGTMGTLTDGYIAPGQSFWVQTSTASPNLTISEGAKYDNSTSMFYRTENQVDYIEFSLTDGVTIDKSYLKFLDGSTGLYSKGEDTYKRSNDRFNLSSLSTDGVQLAINSIGEIQCEEFVSLHIADVSPGSHTLSFDLSNNGRIYESYELIDQVNNEVIDLQKEPNYEFEVSEEVESFQGRFVLAIRKEMPESYLEPDFELGCDGSNGVLSLVEGFSNFEYQLVYSDGSTSEVSLGNNSQLNFQLDSAKLEHNIYPTTILGGWESCTLRSIGTIEFNAAELNCHSLITGTLDDEGVAISLYPNPTNQALISLSGKIQNLRHVSIYSSTGVFILEKEIQTIPSDQLDLTLPSSIANGLYFVHLLRTDGVTTLSFVVDR